jgi:hypothetical protein
MAKRFTDTAKWEKPWFRKLDAKYKCAWLFLCDRCDHAGIWEIDDDAFRYFLGVDISIADLLEVFEGKIQIVNDNKLFITSFIEFQYGELNPENRVHLSVLNRLKKLHLKPLIRGLEGCKDKYKDKEKDKDKDPSVGISNWHDAASSVMAMLVKYGDWSKSKAEVIDKLGAPLFDLACRAGTHRIRMIHRDRDAVFKVIGMLKDASQQRQLFTTIQGQLAEVSQ